MPTLLRVYGHALARIPRDLAKQPWVLLLPVLYSVLQNLCTLLVGMIFRGPLAIVGGFALGFVEALLFAGFLYFVDEVVAGSPVKIAEIPQSFRRYFWPVVNVLFVVWIAMMLLGVLMQRSPLWLNLAIYATAFILFNATPEVIYQRRLYGGLDVFRASLEFIQANWIEWFIPNLLIGAAAAALLLGYLPLQVWLAVTLGPFIGGLVYSVILGALLFVAMLFRGHLFAELDGSSARARRFRYGR